MPTVSKETEDTIPSWLNKEFLENSLKSEASDGDVRITSCNIKRATAPGDNYLSLMYRATLEVTIRGHSEKRSLIIKAQPEGENIQKVVKNYRLFELEAKMLKDVLPAMHELLRELELENFSPFSAKCLYSHFGPPAHVIVLEDLKESGFQMVERTAGLDQAHCMMVMRKIAQFHAASMVLKEKNPELLETFLDPPSQDMLLEEFSDFFENFLNALCDELDEKCEDLKKFTGRIRKIAERAMVRWGEGRARNEKEFNVLAHGDPWVNNMMFHYSKDGHLTDLRFVDYQLSLWTSPAVDLLYFLNSSPSINLLKDQTMFIKEYHKVLGETLSAFGYQDLHIPLDQLNEQLENRGFFGMLSVFAIRSAVLADEESILDVDGMVNNDEMTHKFSKLYIESLKTQIPLLDEKGWLY